MFARRAAFTLIELMAVVLLIALVAGIVYPGLRGATGRPLREQADRLATDLELARLQSQLRGVPHRVLLDLDGRAWRMEWLTTEGEALGVDDPAAREDEEPLSRRERLDLAPPKGEERSFHPVASSFGQISVLDDGLAIARIDTTEGPLSRGAVSIVFDVDGSTEPCAVVLADEDGRELALDVEALEEEVRVRALD